MLAGDEGAPLRPTLIDCFPHPAASRISGTITSTPQMVLNEWRRLHSLIAICCVAQRTHLLVGAEVPSQLTLSFLQPMLPRGPKFFELRLTPETTREEVSEFMVRAELANVSSAFGCSLPPAPATSASSMPQVQRPVQGHRRQLSAGTASSDDGKDPFEVSPAAMEAAMSSTLRPQPTSLSSTHGPSHHQRRVVVLLHNVELASRAVHSAIMDVVAHGQSRTPTATRRVQSVRIVAFCRGNAYAMVPIFLRSAFCLSAWISAEASTRSVDLHGSSPDSSTVVNRAVMQELCDDEPVIDAAHVSVFTERFMYDVVVCLRGSIVPNTSTAAGIVSRVPHLLLLLRIAALLFSASDDRQDDVIDGIARVVVTPTDVACFAPHFVAHLLHVCKKEASVFLRLAGDRGAVAPRAMPPQAAWPLWDALVVAQRRTGSAVSPCRRRQSGSILHSNVAFVATGAFPSPVHEASEDHERSACPFVSIAEAFGLVVEVLRCNCPPPG